MVDIKDVKLEVRGMLDNMAQATRPESIVATGAIEDRVRENLEKYRVEEANSAAFSFSSALMLVKKGKAVRRRFWEEGKYIVKIRNYPAITVHYGKNYVDNWHPTPCDLLAVDWETC
ncbi:MAG: DUF2829 domain-containing protein [Candidatus Dadabacteria bacterium]|nr:DUF2829 domain-containing protein [Candidatus Dadabacteria bacterium]